MSVAVRSGLPARPTAMAEPTLAPRIARLFTDSWRQRGGGREEAEEEDLRGEGTELIRPVRLCVALGALLEKVAKTSELEPE